MINCYSVSLWKRRGVKTADHTSKCSDKAMYVKWFLSTNSFILPCLSTSEEAASCASLLWLAPVSRTRYVISYASTSSKTMNNMNCTVDTLMTKHLQEKTSYSRNSSNVLIFYRSEMFTLLFRQSNAESKIPCTRLLYAPQNQLKWKTNTENKQ